MLLVLYCTNFDKKGKIPKQKLNILLINNDEMGWRDVGFMGSEYYETLNIDALTAGGMIFTNAYASASNCAPSRACMMSGQGSPRYGIYTVTNPEPCLLPNSNSGVRFKSCIVGIRSNK
ncbi:MAG: sulfatase-like hydrolase/transferase [Prolixibacteraceae bacterium]|nr:sulfatase-like hydrolase/transferase [Prolixibacteraceae bacterium]MBT6007418.1 sulfatase-like hydrolase/transferase [Prolixibacteraceae bacterium]MBT6764808.1 sulfatase-like hydrolase/transferase [Prolixibacteraceae bacterium]MBT6999716.1 sulfatase-like hydrolase/transferase [Prolixibacteraceae bacterium]MBT7394210.1 sulfatase-like hydrolase/transferase [Prolixibacteraceae bacterium]